MIDDRSKTGRLTGLFLIGCVLFNYPILTMFNLKIMLFGIPMLYLYLFTAWLGLIVLIIFVTKIRTKASSTESTGSPDAFDLFGQR